MQERQPEDTTQVELLQEHIDRIDQFRRRKDTAVLVIMFTDLVGSTSLAEHRGEEYARRVIRLHNQMLLDIIERDGRGLVIRTVGDAFLCVFSEPSSAVKAALDIQRELKEYNGEHPEDEDISVRIGLHMGQVSVEDQIQPDIFGRHVNRAARVAGLADGGHIYLSRSVYENASGWLKESDLIWQTHGNYKVKGIEEPIRIYEVADEDSVPPKAPLQKRYVPLRDRLKIPIAIAATCIIVFLATFSILRHLGYLRSKEPEGKSIAIAYFENITPNSEHDWLQKGLTAMLITDLTKLSGFEVVDRGLLQETLEQMNFGKTGIVSRSIAQKVGKALGVDSILTGSYIITKPNIRIDAHLISIKNNKVIKAEEIQGELDQIYQLEKQLARRIASSLDVTPTPEEAEALAVVATESLSATEFYSRGLDYLDRAMDEEAIDAFKKAAAADPGFHMPRWAVIATSIIKNASVKAEDVDAEEYKEIVTILRSLQGIPPPRAYADTGMLEEAIKRFERMAEAGNRSLENHIALGLFYNIKGSFLWLAGDMTKASQLVTRSIEELEAALGYGPPRPASAAIHSTMAMDYGMMSRVDEVGSQFQKAVAAMPKWGFIRYFLGNYYMALEQYDKAAAEYKEVVNVEPEYADGYRGLGIALRLMGRYGEASDALKKATELQEYDTHTQEFLASTHSLNGNYDDAITIYRKILETQPDQLLLRIRSRLFHLYSNKGTKDKAAAIYLAIKPEHAAYYQLGEAFARSGMLDDAIAAYRKAIGLEPDYVEAQNRLADAIEGKRRCNRASPQSEQENYNSREICAQHLRDISEAIQEYKLDHGDVPDWLSDLYPRYLQDPDILICPHEDSELGGVWNGDSYYFLMGSQDPRMPCSYQYRFSPIRYPAPGAPRTWKERSISQIEDYGDKVPIVRCFWSIPGKSLNLGYGGQVYESLKQWEEDTKAVEE